MKKLIVDSSISRVYSGIKSVKCKKTFNFANIKKTLEKLEQQKHKDGFLNILGFDEKSKKIQIHSETNLTLLRVFGFIE